MRADVFDPAKRSAVMRAVKSRDTAPELTVRAAVRELGYARRYRLNGACLPGKPDLVFGAMRKAVFVHGCFWHGHTCAKASKPKSNADYWLAKIAGNKARDRQHNRALRGLGWRVLTVFECAAQPSRIDRLTPRLIRFLES